MRALAPLLKPDGVLHLQRPPEHRLALLACRACLRGLARLRRLQRALDRGVSRAGGRGRARDRARLSGGHAALPKLELPEALYRAADRLADALAVRGALVDEPDPGGPATGVRLLALLLLPRGVRRDRARARAAAGGVARARRQLSRPALLAARRRSTPRTRATLGFAWEYEARSHRGRVEHGQEATPIVVDGVLYVSGPWGSRVRGRREDRGGALALRPRGRRQLQPPGLLRRREPRRAGVERPRLRRHARRLPGRARRDERRGAVAGRHADRPRHALLHHHRTAAGREGRGGDRQQRGRVRRARLRHRLRPGDRAPSAGASSPCRAIRRAASRSIPSSSARSRPGTRTPTGSPAWAAPSWGELDYDPELELLYVGTGNSSPYPIWLRSPSGGDNLYPRVDPRARSRRRPPGLALPDDAAARSGTTPRRRT